MKTVALDTEIKIDNPETEIDVHVTYRCWMNEHAAMYPMKVEGSIFQNCSLQEFISDGKKDYEKSYIKVDVVKVEVDM